MNAQSKQPRNPCGQGVPIRFQRGLETNDQIKQQNPPLQGVGLHKQNDHESEDLVISARGVSRVNATSGRSDH
jgi:hypothetical protein